MSRIHCSLSSLGVDQVISIIEEGRFKYLCNRFSGNSKEIKESIVGVLVDEFNPKDSTLRALIKRLETEFGYEGVIYTFNIAQDYLRIPAAGLKAGIPDGINKGKVVTVICLADRYEEVCRTIKPETCETKEMNRKIKAVVSVRPIMDSDTKECLMQLWVHFEN